MSAIAKSIYITVGDFGTKNVSVIQNSEVSVVRGGCFTIGVYGATIRT